MNWLITGGCGFIGVNLVKKLLDTGDTIKIIDNLSVGSLTQLKSICEIDSPFSNVSFYNYDIGDAAAMYNNVFEDIDVIVHLAARSGVRESVIYPEEWFYHNVIGTFNIYNVARRFGVNKIVAASSGASVGDCTPPVHEELPMHPISPYGASKSFMETFASAFSASYGMKINCLRFSNVYGPYSSGKESLVAKFIKRVKSGETFNVYGDGNQTRDFIHVDDLNDAIIKCALSDIGGEVFQICHGTETPVNDVISKLSALFYEFDNQELRIIVENVAPKIGDIRTNWADNSKFKSMIDWQPVIDLDEGLRTTFDWFMKND